MHALALGQGGEEVAAAHPATVSTNILTAADCESMGMGCFLGVAACSREEPQFIHMTLTPPGGGVGEPVALVGKGLTFDSGGYNLKVGTGMEGVCAAPLGARPPPGGGREARLGVPASVFQFCFTHASIFLPQVGGMIEMMKFDMGGSAAVIGAADALASLPSLPPSMPVVHVIVAACENMIDGAGMRPGDVLSAADGTTVEVNNTDAEGRLTLADAIWFAQEKCGATAIVDIATLTGACMVGLGQQIAGLLAKSDDAAAAVAAAARSAGEKVWRLPLDEAYADALKSPIADLKNSGGRYGGTITAGLFLAKFYRDSTSWAHLDIAGPAWDDAAGGATGFGVATLTEWALARGRKG